MRVIELDTAETFYSLRHRLLNGERGRIVLVVPARGVALRGGVDLPLLRRLADRERLDVGLVTTDRDLARQARGVGLPAFSSLALAEHYRPGWWRGRRRAERLGFPPGPVPDHPSVAATIGRSRRLWRALLLLLALVLLAALPLVAALYFLPRATITLRPAAQPAQIIVELTADPALTTADAAPVIPARPVSLSLLWEATAPGTNATARQQARALALQALGAGADARLAARLNPGERLVPGATQVTLSDEQFTTGSGTTRLALQAESSGLAVAEAEVVRLLFPQLAAALPASFAADPATLRLDLEPGAGDGAFVVTARAAGRAQLDPAGLAAQLAGQPLNDDDAAALNALPLAEPPHFEVWPSWWLSWFGRFPLRPERITIDVTEWK